MLYPFAMCMYPSRTLNPFEGWADYAGLKKEWKELSGWEKVCDSIIKLYDVTTLGGYVVSQKHWEMAKWDHSVTHGTLAVLQGLPIAGIVFVALEILISLTVAISISVCCGNDKLSDAHQASRDYFEKMKQIESTRDANDKDNRLVGYVRELASKGDPVSFKRAQYVAKMVSSEEERVKILEKLKNPDTLFEEDLAQKLAEIQTMTYAQNQANALMSFSEGYESLAYKNKVYKAIIDIAIANDSNDIALNIPYSELTEELKSIVEPMFKTKLQTKITELQEESPELSQLCHALVNFVFSYDRFYQHKVYEAILNIASNSEELSFHLSLPYDDLSEDLMKEVNKIFNEMLEKKLEVIRNKGVTPVTSATELLDFAGDHCDYPLGQEKVYRRVIDIALERKTYNSHGSIENAETIIKMLPYRFLSESLQQQVQKTWPDVVDSCWSER